MAYMTDEFIENIRDSMMREFYHQPEHSIANGEQVPGNDLDTHNHKMENSLKRSQYEAEDELAAKQQKVEEDQKENHEEYEQPAVKFIKPQLAFEIFTALPIAHQRRLLPIWSSIYEDHPIPDQWTRWKIFKWSVNRWNPSYTSEPVQRQLSSDGLNFGLSSKGNEVHGLFNAIQRVEFTPTPLEGPQICYFEAKHIRGHYLIGYRSSIFPFNYFGIRDYGKYYHCLHDELTQYTLPNVAPILDEELTTIGCGLFKYLGKLKVFFTKNGQLLAKPIPLPSTTPTDELFPIIYFFLKRDSDECRFEKTNFGLKPFQFKYKGNEEKLMEEMIFEWSGNRWDPRLCAKLVQISNDGLSFNMASGGDRTFGYVTAIYAFEFLPTHIDGPQICYYEAKHIRGNFSIGFITHSQPYNSFVVHASGEYRYILDNERAEQLLPNIASILDEEFATIGCGLWKHLGKRKIFFTKDGQLIAKPIPLPSTASDLLFPAIFLYTDSADCLFEDTNFGLNEFQFKCENNKMKLSEEIGT